MRIKVSFLLVMLFMGMMPLMLVPITYAAQTITPSVVDSVAGVDWTIFWAKFHKIAMWDLEYYNGSDWLSKKELMDVIVEYPKPNHAKITLDFTGGEAGNYRLTFAINNIVRKYVEKASNWHYNLTYDDFAIVFDWSDAKSIAGIEFSHGVKDSYFWFRIRRDGVPAGYRVIIDPSIVATSVMTSATAYAYQTKAFYANGLHWMFYSSGAATNNLLYKTSANGSSWSAATSILVSGGSLINDDGRNFGVFHDDTFVHIVAAVDAPDWRILYRRGITNANGTITWSAGWSEVKVLASFIEYDCYPSIAVDSNGYPWVGYNIKIAHIPLWFEAHITKSSRNDGVWLTDFDTRLYENTAGAPYFIYPVPLLEGKMYVLHGRVDTVTLYGQLYDGGWGSIETITSDIEVAQAYDAVAIENNVHIVWLKGSANNVMYRTRTYGVGLADQYTISSTTDLTFPSITKRPAAGNLIVFWMKSWASDDIYYRKGIGTSWGAETFWFSDSTNGGMWYGTTGSFYNKVEDFIGFYYTRNSGSPYDVMFNPLNEWGFDFEITNMDAGDWLFAEDRNYEFVSNFTSLYFKGEPLISLEINFTDGANRLIHLNHNFSTNMTSVVAGADFSMVAREKSTITVTEDYSTIMFRVMLRAAIVDKFNVDFSGKISTENETSGWAVVASGYANIYSRGGLTEYTSSGPAYKIAGGDIFEFHANKSSNIKGYTYYRKLQHVKLKFSWDLDDPIGNNPVAIMYYRIGMEFKRFDNSDWQNGFYVELKFWSIPPSWTNDRWLRFDVNFYNNGALISTFTTITWYNFEGSIVKTPATFWVDIWINKANASSVFGIRVVPYWYGMAQYGYGWFGEWTWVAQTNYTRNAMSFGVIKDNSNNTVHAADIAIQRLWAQLAYPDIGNPIETEVKDFTTFDFTISQREFHGIQTPTSEETKEPRMPAGNILSPLFSALFSLLEQSFAYIVPALDFIGSAAVGMIDGLLFYLSGESGLFSGFLTFTGSIISTAVSFMATIPTSIIHVATLVVNSFTWFFDNFFVPMYGILGFVLLNPTFNVFGAIASIIGVSTAWLAGTTYTNVWNQTYDFSYLSSINVLGVTGGAGIFMLIFVVGFFLQLMSCIAKMSLGPIVDPVRLIWRMILATTQLLKIMWDIVIGIISLLIKIAHAIRDLLPRPFGW